VLTKEFKILVDWHAHFKQHVQNNMKRIPKEQIVDEAQDFELSKFLNETSDFLKENEDQITQKNFWKHQQKIHKQN